MGRGRGRTIRERRLGRGCHVVWTHVGRGPAALARPRACRPDGGIPPGRGGRAGTSTARPVVAPDVGRGVRVAGGPVPPPRGRGHPATLRDGRVRVLGGRTAPTVGGPRSPRVRARLSGTRGAPRCGPQCRRPTAVPEVVLAPPATSWALFPGFTLQPLGDGPLLAFPAGAAPPGLLAALRAFFPVEEAPPGDLPGEGDGPEPQAGDLDLGLELDAAKDDEYLVS